MKKTTTMRLSASIVTALSMLTLSSSASAQFARRGAQPAAGACFYEHINYGGRSFCTSVGDSNPRVPSHVNDEISSIRVFGNAEVIVFRDGNMNGESRRFSSSVRDLRQSRFNDRMTSYVVQVRGYNGYRGSGYGNYGNAGAYGAYDRGYGGTYSAAPNWSGSRAAGSRWTYSQADAMVRQGYRRVFGREPDPGARGWVDQVVQHNWSQRQLEAALRNTPEGRGR